MGGSESKTKILNEAITDVTMKSVVKHTTSAAGSIDAVQKNVFRGDSRNINILQTANIDISVISDTAVNESMQTDILTKIMAEIEKEKSGLPEITSSKSDSEIRNIVRNNISSTFEKDKMDSLLLNIELDQEIIFLEGSKYSHMGLTQEAAAVGELTSTMSAKIVNELVAGTDLEGKSKEVTKNAISDIVTSVTDGISKVVNSVGDIFGFSPEMIGLFLVVVVVGYMIASKQLDKQPMGMGMGMPMSR